MKKSIAIISILLGASTVWAALIKDHFNRDNVALTTDGSQIGANWVSSKAEAQWGISGNRLISENPVSPAGQAVLYNTGVSTVSGNGTNLTVSLDVMALSGVAWAGIVFNYQDANNFYWFRYKGGASDWSLSRFVGGNSTSIASGTIAGTFSLNTDYTLKVTSTNAYTFDYEIKATVAGTVMVSGSATDANSNFTGGYAGVLQSTTGVNRNSFDNFKVQRGLYYHIDNEVTVVDDIDPWRLYQDNTYNEVGDGSTNVFNTILETHPNDSLRPWTTASIAYKGSRSLVFRWNATSTGLGDVKDKVMYAIGPHYNSGYGNKWDPDSVLYADGLKYVGFALCIPSTNFMALRNGIWTLLFQSYQVNAGTVRPPFAMHISRDNQTASKVDLLFLIRNDDTNYVQQTGNTENARESILIPNIKRNTWYEFVIRLKPSLSETNGNVMVWMAEGDNLPSSSSPDLNNYRVVNYNGSWGYDVGTNTPTFSQQIGMYSAEVDDRPASIYVDEMKYGTTFNLVNP